MNDFLDSLINVIAERKANPQAKSYTNALLDDPVRAAQKVGEEATEVVVAALTQSDERLLDEMADLVYHSLVLLSSRDLQWDQVIETLERRHNKG
jgi:phosphoribosyl-ATP pyrophosphohydrolase